MTCVRTYKDDCALGFQSESTHLSLLNDCFEDDFKKLPRYHSMDFEGSTCWIEMKTRVGISSKTFPSMMVPMSKILFALHTKKPVYFVFVLTDGVFYSKFDAAKYFYYGDAVWCRQDRPDHKDTPQRYCFIPTEDLDWIAKYEST